MLYTIPVLFLLSGGNFAVDFTLMLPEPVVACTAVRRRLNRASGQLSIHFTCYTEDGKKVYRVISGVQKT